MFSWLPRRKKGSRWYSTLNSSAVASARNPSKASRTLFLPIHPCGHIVSETILQVTFLPPQASVDSVAMVAGAQYCRAATSGARRQAELRSASTRPDRRARMAAGCGGSKHRPDRANAGVPPPGLVSGTM